MTPVASTATARAGRVAVPRRVNGPVRRRPAPAHPLGPRVARRAAEVADARLLDRLIRGRAWIAVIGVMLMGLVFVQVSMLRLNTGIGRDVATAAQLERSNQQLRNTVAELGAGERIEAAAQKEGLVMPAAGKVRYLTAGKARPDAAARGISAPAPVQQLPQPQPVTATPTTATTAVTPAATPTATPVVTPQQAVTPQQQTTAVQPQQTPTAVAAGNGGVAAAP